MPYYQRLGEIPRKHHIWFHRNGAAPTYKNEGIAYEHVFTTQGFDEAYSICITCGRRHGSATLSWSNIGSRKRSPTARCAIII